MKSFKMWVAGLVLAAAMTIGCIPPAAQGPQSRADARAIVLAMTLGVSTAADLCAAYVNQSHDLVTRQKCVAALQPAADATETLAAAVDAWQAADSGQLPCMAAPILSGLKDLEKVLADAKVGIPAEIDDALTLAQALVPACSSPAPAPAAQDGGAQ